MALINCPECNHRVSTNAVSCPKCGSPITKNSPGSIKVTRTGAVLEGVGFLFILVGIIIAMATDTNNHTGGFIGTAGIVLFLVGRFK